MGAQMGGSQMNLINSFKSASSGFPGMSVESMSSMSNTQTDTSGQQSSGMGAFNNTGSIVARFKY